MNNPNVPEGCQMTLHLIREASSHKLAAFVIIEPENKDHLPEGLPIVYTLKGYSKGRPPLFRGVGAIRFLYEAVQQHRMVNNLEGLSELSTEKQQMVSLMLGKPPPPPPAGKAQIRVTSEIYQEGARYGFLLWINGKEKQRSPALFGTAEEARAKGSQVLELVQNSIKDTMHGIQ